MRCLNCGGIGVIWNPDTEGLWCVDCQTIPAGMELTDLAADNIPSYCGDVEMVRE